MNEPAIDLTGKLIIKVALGDDIRRILITNEDITYDELVLMMQRVYRGKLSSNDDIVIKYKDEDNDLITIFDSSDLTFAIQCSRILKITLFVNNKPEPLQTDEIKMIKGELKHIRERCNKLLDQLDDRVPSNTPSRHLADSSTGTLAPAQSTESPKRPSPSPRVAPPTSVAGSKEFDPLSTQRSLDEQQNKVMSSFGISGNQDRPGTPDSVSSVGSSSSARQPPPQPPQQPAQPAQQPGAISQPNNPGQQAPHPGYAQSGQKAQPWQNQPPQAPSAVTGTATFQNQAGYPVNSTQAMPGYTGTYGTSQPQSFPSSTPQASQPGYTAPFSQPGGQSQAQMYGSQAQSMPYSPQQVPAGQPVLSGQTGQAGPQQQQQPGYGGAYPHQQQPQQPPVQGQPGAGNPYARQGPGYGTGYPRPAGNYPQGYQ